MALTVQGVHADLGGNVVHVAGGYRDDAAPVRVRHRRKDGGGKRGHDDDGRWVVLSRRYDD